MRRYLILGTGVAGVSAAQAIRETDGGAEINLIGNEADGYYSRPGLAYFLTGEIPEQFLYPYTKQELKSLGLRFNHALAVRLLPQSHQVELNTGQLLSYDRLLIATGARAAQLSLSGKDLNGVVKLDNIEDARGILRLSRRARTAVVVGGGITALEIVEGLRERGLNTHYFLRGDRYWSKVLDKIESKIVEDRLREEGVKIHYRTELGEILSRGNKVAGIKKTDGSRLKCQIVAVAVGVRPRIELAEAAGLNVDRGILVDEYLRTSVEDVFAAGDVAQVYDPFTGRAILDSLWGAAREQGRRAGLNMAEKSVPYHKTMAFNVTRLAGLTTTIIGAVGGRGVDEDIFGIVRGDSETWRHIPDAIAAQSDFDVNRIRLMIGENTIEGAVIMGDQTLSQAIHHIISKRMDISPIRDALLVSGAPISDILTDFWVKRRAQIGSI